MARIETDPYYTTPTFSRATAAADIFKKEDVQQVAAALSTHVHDGTGKGLAIAASGIPADSITSAMILDGTIATVDLAAHAVTQDGAYLLTRGGTTTSTTAVALSPAASVTLTSTGGDVLLWVQVPFSVSSASAVVSIYVQRDAGAWNVLSALASPTAGVALMAGGWLIDLAPAAGAHTWQIGWSTNAGTASVNAGANTQLIAVELKR